MMPVALISSSSSFRGDGIRAGKGPPAGSLNPGPIPEADFLNAAVCPTLHANRHD